MEYLSKQKLLIYVKLQSINPEIRTTGIKQWDKMESLIERITENKNNKEYLNHLYKKILQLKGKENGRERE